MAFTKRIENNGSQQGIRSVRGTPLEDAADRIWSSSFAGCLEKETSAAGSIQAQGLPALISSSNLDIDDQRQGGQGGCSQDSSLRDKCRKESD